jgi:hypothetical protein
MGPVLIFDKSTLQSLSPDEAVWLDNFFLSNITPLFFIETLADLEKQVRGGRTAEDVVGNLAYKTPDMHSSPSIHHMTLLEGELRGLGQVDMRYGRPILHGGQPIELAGKMGVLFQQSPEEEAFQRWQRSEFLDIERTIAKKWRQDLAGSGDLEQISATFKEWFTNWQKPKTLSEAKSFVDFMIERRNQEHALQHGLSVVGVPEDLRDEVQTRWRAVGRPPVRQFAPYFTYVYSVDFLFNIAVAADLIGKGRASNSVDIAYLYYLPFCLVFTSNDKLHADIVPLFLRANQSFVPGTELKRDLSALDRHYDALPPEVKAEGLMRFASYPPDDTTFLVTRLWDKFMNLKWREQKASYKPPTKNEATDKLLEQLRRFEKDAKRLPLDTPFNSDEVEHLAIKRSVYGKKGKWSRFPPEVLNQEST